MAGPTCSVFYPQSDDRESQVAELLRRVADRRDGEDSFWVRDTHSIGGSYRGEGRPFIFDEDEEARDPDEAAEIERILGGALSGEIGLAAMCNQPEDHRILAEVALWLAERLAGYVDLGGDIAPSLPLPGRVFSISYAISDGVRGWCTVLDASALRARLSDPDFHMIK